MLEKILDQNKKKILQEVVDIANKYEKKIYMVGGTVRDIFLQRDSWDIDLVLEGNALEFAGILHRTLGGELKTYDRFLGATINLGGFSLDLMTARKEIYKSYGALPEITPGNINDDLKRRDFTVNALAINLIDGKVIDPFGGINDLKNRQLRILHKNSFKEDPTRILRAARYMARLRFKLEVTTYNQLCNAKPFITEVSANRLKREFIKICNDKASLKSLRLMEGWGVLPYILPGISLKRVNKNTMDYFNSSLKADQVYQEKWLLILMAIYWQAADNVQDILEVRFDFSNKELNCINWLVRNKPLLLRLINSEAKLSFLNIHRMLYNTPQEVEVFLLWVLGEKRKLYYKEIKLARQQMKLPLSGKDLLEMGVNPGPFMGKLLNELEEQVLLINISSREDALKWIKTKLNDLEKGF